MRLIDADELKNEMKEKCKWLCKDLSDIIDNAPTVEPVTKLKLTDLTEEDKKNFILLWQRATSKGLLVEPERPQGEWVYRVNGFSNMSMEYCSICNFPTPIYLDKPNFCPNCGAEMRKGEES